MITEDVQGPVHITNSWTLGKHNHIGYTIFRTDQQVVSACRKGTELLHNAFAPSQTHAL